MRLKRFGCAVVLVASLSNVTKYLIKATKKGNVYFGSPSGCIVHRGQEGVLAGASSGSREINAGACLILSQSGSPAHPRKRAAPIPSGSSCFN